MPDMELPKGVKVEIVKMTPENAEKALIKNEVNRAVRENRVLMYQADMENGNWDMHSALIFDEDGKLIDGQHRLTAQIRSNMIIWWVVITGVPRETQATIDNTATRSPADQLRINGYGNTQLLTAVARICIRLERGDMSSTRHPITTVDVLDFVEEHPEVVRSAEQAGASIKGMTPIRPSVLGAAHWWISQYNDSAEADAFLGRIYTLTENDPNSPVLALNRRANEIKRTAQRVHFRDFFYMVIKAWNYDCEGVGLKKIATYAKKGGYQIPIPDVRAVSQLLDDEDEESNGSTNNDGDEVVG